MKKKKEASLENSLFAQSKKEEIFQKSPLSVRMRPQSLADFVGQEHILGEGKLLQRVISADRLSSVIFYGPPGTGKTTLAHCISLQTKAAFQKINAVSSSVEELRGIIGEAKNQRILSNTKTILFIDEIHRFNKAQQDVLMPELEEGILILIGATVSNPFFSITGPLLSRTLIFEFKSLSQAQIATLLRRALTDKQRGLGQKDIFAEEEAIAFLAERCDGDARRALNALEVGALTAPLSEGKRCFTLSVAEECIQKKQVVYDRDGDSHYDVSSAFIKSMRGSDCNATLYWLATMIYAGEDPRFIARRICICAAEDVGTADPQALILANAAFEVCEFIGFPEARIPLAEAAVYVASAPKSNAVYVGIDKALEDVKTKKMQKVPEHLKDSSYKGAKGLGHGSGYKYAHNYENHYVDQKYMEVEKVYYSPTEIGYEKIIKERLTDLKNQKERKHE